MDETKNVTEREKQILKYFADHGPSWGYELYKKKKIASNKTVVRALQHLNTLGLTEKKGKEENSDVRGRKRDCHGLTFHGVLYGLNLDFFSSKEAADVRLRNFAEIPSPNLEPEREASRIAHVDTGFRQFVQLFIPQMDLTEVDRIRDLMKSQLEPEMASFQLNIQRVTWRARKKRGNVRLFSMVEKEFSERIYEKLRKVNPDIKYYDQGLAGLIFEKEHNECVFEFFGKFLASDESTTKKMAECWNDKYSVEVLQKGLFVFFARLFSLGKKPIESMIEFASEGAISEFRASWEETQKQLDRFSKMTAGDLRSELMSLAAKIKQQQRMTPKINALPSKR